MAINKKESFSPSEQQVADFARALAHPARVAILKVLAERESCVCGEIVEVMPLAQSTVSQHLKALLESGLIQGTIDGPRSCYCINRSAFEQFEDIFKSLFLQLGPAQTQKSCC